MSVEKLVEHFSALEDPRCAGKVDHRLIDILVIAVCAVIACAESWDDIGACRKLFSPGTRVARERSTTSPRVADAPFARKPSVENFATGPNFGPPPPLFGALCVASTAVPRWRSRRSRRPNSGAQK